MRNRLCNLATNVVTSRTTSGAGTYSISPWLPGFYSVRVTAKGFKALQQDNLTVNAMGTLGFNPAGVGVFDYRDNR
ncbi:MAG TPA: carboxypeptidase-like regulatory domain-containing protein, partial [Candidatus Sulfotelmatobacter sp.]|nr:carboxypeptidase-like regulatory domain-containing protein [Candidatus Sulfotelmatobacter sp.]